MKNTLTQQRIGIALLCLALVLFAATARIMPHPANFAPIAAIAIAGGALLPRRIGVALPLIAMIVSDLIIGLHPLIMFTWGSFALIALLSTKTLSRITPLSVFATSFLGSVLFYVITNFGVWAEGRLYPLTAQGLVDCYVNALPFFRNTMLGDLLYVSLFFGAYALVRAMLRKPTPATATAVATLR